MNLLETRGLKKYFRVSRRDFVHAVDDVSFEVRDKEVLGLVGESGSGKSTLGKTICGLLDKTGGQVIYKGERLPDCYRASDFARLSKMVQMIFQDPYSSLNPRMTVKDIVGEGLRIHGGLTENQVVERVVSWIERVSLHADHLSRYPHEFSGGQRQRIGIARALIMEPEFLVCDEPISALDVSVQAQVVNLLGELKNQLGLTLLFIAHDLSMVRYISDRMAVMYLGSLVEIGPSDQVYFEPKHPYTQMLVKSNPEADPRVERGKAKELIRGEIPSPLNLGAGCRFVGRCPKVMERCRRETPQLRAVGKDHKVSCHLYG